MNDLAPLLLSQRVIQICLFLLAAIALLGGTLQMVVGQPETTPRLDNVHRFLAGIYFGCGVIALWTGWTIRDQSTLVLLIAFAVLLAGIGRLVSMAQVGLPEPRALWLAYVGSELILPCIMVAAYIVARGAGSK